jgi:hypothetical protein
MPSCVRNIIGVVLLAVWCVSCSQPVTRNDVIGTYEVDYGYGIGELQLFGDGRYQQTFRLNQSSAQGNRLTPGTEADSRPA